MITRSMIVFLLAVFLVLVQGSLVARADTVVVVVENTSPLDGMFFTPLWVAAHDGSFDIWSSGALASSFPGLEELAEEGTTGVIGAHFESSPAGLAGGSHSTIAALDVPAPVFTPGEARTFVFDVGDSLVNRYFSYASMVIPSNDLFFATSVPTAYEMFDVNGQFAGPFTIEIYGSDVVDAGTEVNDIGGGAAFSALGGAAVDENNPLADIFVTDPTGAFLQTIVDTPTANGATIGSVFGPSTLIARITVKQPSSVQLRVTVENREPSGGFFLTPVWVAMHNGGFDVWSSGEPASSFPGLEELAEDGLTGPIQNAFLGSPAGQAGGVDATIAALDVPLPVLSPGESAGFDFPVGDPLVNRYLSYASMVIPTNDLFVANSQPMAHEIFAPNGTFLGPIVIDVLANDIVDCGTELNDIAAGAAFSVLGGTGVTEMQPLTDYFVRDPTGSYLATIVGTATAAGETIDSTFAPADTIFRITVELVGSASFVRGDVNGDGAIQITDAINLIQGLFGLLPGGYSCQRAADVNDSNTIDIADPLILLTHLLLAGPPPPSPYPSCGADSTPDLLDCAAFTACP